jgi:glycosyltransferase involved in cell wall biosynthesis
VRVALFTNNYLPFCGGVTVSVETLRGGLQARGHDVWVFAPRFASGPPDPPWVIRYPSVPAATYPDFSLAIPYSPRIARQVRGLDFDIFHTHHPFLLGPAARRMGRRQHRPVVFTYHTRYEKYAHYVPLTKRLVEAAAIRLSTRFAARADAVIAPSQVIRDDLRGRGVSAPIAVVPTGIDLGHFRPGNRAAARRRLGLAAEGPVVLYVGRLDPEKSVGRILHAFERIASIVPDARLVLVGQGTDAERLRRQARALVAAPRIVFLGGRPHAALPECYQAADLFLFASETETQGLVLAEAAASGLPSVAVSAPGCDEVVRDGDTGLLTKADPAALAEAAIGLLLDPARRRGMGERARLVAEGEFDVRLQIDRTLAVYARARAMMEESAAPRRPR